MTVDVAVDVDILEQSEKGKRQDHIDDFIEGKKLRDVG